MRASPTASGHYSSLLQAALASAKVDHDAAAEAALAAALAAQAEESGAAYATELDAARASLADVHRAAKKEQRALKKAAKLHAKELKQKAEALDALRVDAAEARRRHRRASFRGAVDALHRTRGAALSGAFRRWSDGAAQQRLDVV